MFAGRPLIAYAIEVGLRSPSVERVVVSTDDEEIAEVARACGAEVPFMRPAELAGDAVADLPVFMHVLNELRETQGYRPEYVLNLRCTTPFKTVEDVENVIAKLALPEYDSVRTMTQVHGVYHPHWMYIDKGGFAKSFVPDLDPEEAFQRQSLPEVFRLNGVVDGIKSRNIINFESLWGNKIGLVSVKEERSFDIDTEFDFRLAEIIANNMEYFLER
jgi:CMP-N-acetylneuraminic acid synthetase